MALLTNRLSCCSARPLIPIYPRPSVQPCRQERGTILRIYIPAGAVFNVLNLAELKSPSGICLILRLPFLGGRSGGSALDGITIGGVNVQEIINTVQNVGGSIQVVQE